MEAANASRYTGVSWELWRIMGVEGIQPNNQAYSTIISAAALDKDVGMAIKLLKEMPTYVAVNCGSKIVPYVFV